VFEVSPLAAALTLAVLVHVVSHALLSTVSTQYS
jgi:hypothetical protein